MNDVTSIRMSGASFRAWPTKRVTLLGMSGVGKTRLANILRASDWFHYSVDYRIGTRYLDEPILDNIKREAMRIPFLRRLLMTDSIYISNNITFDNLAPLSSFLGMLGNPDLGGLPLKEFKRRQALHHEAEIAALRDVPEFIDKAESIYGYPHFVHDASGSFCEVDAPEAMRAVVASTLLLYIEASADDERLLIEQAARQPKPLYYREDFLDSYLERYMRARDHEYSTEIDPAEFVTEVFPHLFRARLPRYRAIADTYGYRVPARAALAVESVDDFIDLVAEVLDGD